MKKFLIEPTYVSIWQLWAAIAINLLFDNRLHNNCQLRSQSKQVPNYEIGNLNQILIRKL